jgi:hypothetical protein
MANNRLVAVLVNRKNYKNSAEAIAREKFATYYPDRPF